MPEFKVISDQNAVTTNATVPCLISSVKNITHSLNSAQCEHRKRSTLSRHLRESSPLANHSAYTIRFSRNPFSLPYSPSDKWESVHKKWYARARRNTRKITEVALSSRVIVWMIAFTTRMVLKQLLYKGIPTSYSIANAHLSNSVLHFSFNFCLQITLNNLAPKQALSLRSLKTLNARSVDHR